MNSQTTLTPTRFPSSGSIILKFQSANVLNTLVFLNADVDDHPLTELEAVYSISTDKLQKHTVLRLGGHDGLIVGEIERHLYKRDVVRFPDEEPTSIKDWIKTKGSFLSLGTDKFPLTFKVSDKAYTWEAAVDGEIMLFTTDSLTPIARFHGPQHTITETSHTLRIARQHPTLTMYMDFFETDELRHRVIVSLVEVERVRKRQQIALQQEMRGNFVRYAPVTGGEWSFAGADP